MEAVNDALKLVANAKANIKGYLLALEEHEVWEPAELIDAVLTLEEAIEKLSKVST